MKAARRLVRGSHFVTLVVAALALPGRASALEDCANGVDDDGTVGIDCADPACAPDPACTDVCGVSIAFESGMNGFAPTAGLWALDGARLRTGGPGGLTAGDVAGAVMRTYALSTAMPQPVLEVVYRRAASTLGSEDRFRVCINDPTCAPASVRYVTTTNSGGVTHVAPGFFDGTNDHVFVDLAGVSGPTFTVTLDFNTNGSGGGSFGVAVEHLRLLSDVDGDAIPDGDTVGCDVCWDVDGDGYASESSPGPGCLVDCDDTNDAVSPDASEVCGVAGDEDCDGLENGFDEDDCGLEDCANGQDDNGDGKTDCADPVCTSRIECVACFTGFSFDQGDSGFTTTAFSHGPGNPPGFHHEPITTGVGGFFVDAIDVATAAPSGGWFVLERLMTVPATMAAPRLVVDYRLDGDGVPGQDVFGVCLDSSPSNCRVGKPGVVASVNTPTGTVKQLSVALPAGVHQVGLFYDTVNALTNANNGVEILGLRIISDADGDGLAENSAASCDTCIDGDGDAYGDVAFAPVFRSGCGFPEADCDDDSSVANPGALEQCGLAGDQDCDAILDADEPACAVCGDGQRTGDEACDDGDDVPGDGCSDVCDLEAGALVLTELHISRFSPTASGEQWFELINRSQTTLDVSEGGISVQLQSGRLDLGDDCTVTGIAAIPPGGRAVIALGSVATADGLAPTLACTGFQLAAGGELMALEQGGQLIDGVDTRSFACELQNATQGGVGRSFLITAATPSSTNNDTAGDWCLAATSSSYSNSGSHFGSPFQAGTCAERTCDAIDDDCDGATDELLSDLDSDGTCDARDCAPAVPSCATDCLTDADDDAVADCQDGCIDADGDGFGVKGGLPVSTCALFGGQPAVDCDDTLSFVKPGGVETTAGGACDNGLDDDCDGTPDCLDSACALQAVCAGETCAAPTTLGCGQTVTVDPGVNDIVCGSGADSVYRFVAPSAGNYRVELQNLGRVQYGAFFSRGTCSPVDCAGNTTPTLTTTCAAPGDRQLALGAGDVLFVTVDDVAACAGAGSAQGKLTLRCAEACTGGSDEDGDGKTDCADVDCIANAACTALDFDADGVSTQLELTCGTDPANAGSLPGADAIANTDGDLQPNCVDLDDDQDGILDTVEQNTCVLQPLTAKNDAEIYPGGPIQCAVAGVDGDCDGVFDAASAECGTIEQQCSDTLDNDADGKADCLDIDCVASSLCAAADFDGDGVPNAIELQCNAKPAVAASKPTPEQAADLDDDGLASCIDVDDDGDGSNDTEEIICGSDPEDDGSMPPDLDVDDQCDAVDPDDDGDGFDDALENDCGSSPVSAGSTPIQPGFDTDQDGTCDTRDADRDGDGWSNALEIACGTSVAIAADNPDDSGLNVDGDTLCDAVDPDDDEDGWLDEQELLCKTDSQDETDSPIDTDLDGLCDLLDDDTDGDLWPDVLEVQCGTSPLDVSDNPTALGLDGDDDLLCDKVDGDDDGDGWTDGAEAQCGTLAGSGASKPVDTDGDTVCDVIDDDDDGDGALDLVEELCGTSGKDGSDTPGDADGDGLCDSRDPDADFDGDGWSNQLEGECGTDPSTLASAPTDADGDGQCDALETDDDGDGWPDVTEGLCGTDPASAASAPVDTDKDGTCNTVDTDDDGDGAPDANETLCGDDPLSKDEKPDIADLTDIDGDGDVGCVDTDDDADGLPDVAEALLGSNPLAKDTDGDGLIDGDEDKSHDGILTGTETNPTTFDTDGDGLSDKVEVESCYLGDGAATACQASDPTKSDTDGDGLSDAIEDRDRDGRTDPDETNPLRKDSDGDGAEDGVERQCGTDGTDPASTPVDKDENGKCDGAEVDSDGDEIADGVEVLCGTDRLDASDTPSLDELVDTDGDEVLDCADEDDDGDDALDISEGVCGTNPLSKEETPSATDVVDTDGDSQLDCADLDDDADGLVDEAEATFGTDSLDADTDDDGLSDGREVATTRTSPTVADTDGDGVGDGTEVGETTGTSDTDAGTFIPDANPKTTTDPKNADTDDDGLTDGGEDKDGNGRVDAGESDPLDPQDGRLDTDGDGIPDIVETDPCKGATGEGEDCTTIPATDPTRSDSDGDGVSDKLELDVHGTNPTLYDTDGGGVGDGDELENGTDPLVASDDFSKAIVSGDNMFRCDLAGGTGTPGRFGLGLALASIAVAAFWLRRRRVNGAALLLIAATTALPDAATAQQATGNVNIENFWPAGGRFRSFSVEQSLVAPKWQPYGHLRFHGERQSLRLVVGTNEQSIVDFQSIADVNLGVGLWDVLQLDVGLPLILTTSSGDGVTAIAPLTGSGLGDLSVRIRGTLVDNRVGGFGLGLLLGMTAPTGDGEKFMGDPGFGVLAGLITDYRSERVALALNVGTRIRTEEVSFLGRDFGHELTYGLGLDVAAIIGRIDLGFEIFGRTPLLDPFSSVEDTTLELLAGPKWWIVDGLGLEVAVGAGLIQGYGAPDFRFTAGLMWAPAHDDSDGDGILDTEDDCRLSAEDKDGFGDDDGCPELDNDNDNFLDVADKCPLDPEDKNGIDDDDGCPDGDIDGDRIADARDLCPNEREDLDAYEDQDGCPELDNDHDGILDSADACTEKPETVNGFEDRDGCPDEVPVAVAKTIVQCRLQLGRVYFERARDLLSAESQSTLNDVADAIAAYQVNNEPPLLHVFVSGHASVEGTDAQNYELSLRRSLQVYEFLVNKGISASLLERRGFGEAKPLVDADTTAALKQNRRVEFEIEFGGPCAGVR
ncbi:MAG: OmpA family protein [Myxococcales bacterium]|nr:OmpA family protein [Myxococcales bacterium]